MIPLHCTSPELSTAVAGGDVAQSNRTMIEGGMSDPEFTDMAPVGGLLVGIDIGLGKFVNNDVIKTVRPIYRVNNKEVFGRRYGTDTSRFLRARAKPGYAVAGLWIKAGLVVDSVSVTFMKVNDQGKLDPKDYYQTPWIGGQGGRAPVYVGGTGIRVIGIIGKANNKDVTGLGLLLDSAAQARHTKPGEPSIVSSEPASSSAGSSKLTRQNFDQIQSGMTEDQVTDILGSPKGRSQKTVTSSGSTTQTRVLSWTQVNPNLTITVTFTNERVTGKNWRQINPAGAQRRSTHSAIGRSDMP
jgi:hypothetical protein